MSGKTKEIEIELENLPENHCDENHLVVIDHHSQNKNNKQNAFTGLSKADLLKIEKDEKIWRKLRIGFIIGYAVIWLALLLTSIIIIIVTPKCPPKPDLHNWEKTCLYRVNAFAFKDSDNDKIGDFAGLKSKLDYITDELHSQTLILDPIVAGEFGNDYLHSITDFKNVDATLGSLDDFKLFSKFLNKKGHSLIVTLDLNSVGVEHPWVGSKDYFIQPITNLTWTARNGESVLCSHKGKTYYTSMGAINGECAQIDLNLLHPEVIKEMQDIVKFWISDVNVAGILFTNTRFYIENLNSSQPTQFYGKGTGNFLREIRNVFDEVNSINTKKKVLMIEAGDSVTGVKYDEKDPLLNYLDDDKGTLADVLLLSEFYFRRGWKSPSSDNKTVNQFENRLGNFDKLYSGLERRVAVSTASPYNLRHNNLESITGTYLTHSLSVIYMATELGMTIKNIKERLAYESPFNVTDFDIYPKSSRSLSYLGSDDNVFDKDIFNYAVMPWDSTGGGFMDNSTLANFNDYNKFFGTDDNVELYTASGAPPNYLTLVQTLAKLKKTKESLLWGQLSWMAQPTYQDNGYKRLLFTRHAEGYSKIVVALLASPKDSKGQSTMKGSTVSLSTACEKANLLLSFPLNPFLPKDKHIDMKNVYLDVAANGESLMVLECIEDNK